MEEEEEDLESRGVWSRYGVAQAAGTTGGEELGSGGVGGKIEEEMLCSGEKGKEFEMRNLGY